MKRGEIWTLAGGNDYATKPRPAVIIQDDRFEDTESVTVCMFTTDTTEAEWVRLLVEPHEANGLRAPGRLMVDKIGTVRRTRLRTQVGRLSDEDMARLQRAALVFLGFAGSRRAAKR